LSVGTALLALAIPFAPFAAILGFVPVPAPVLVALLGITIAYGVATELLKGRFYPSVAEVSPR
jgi:Mg2+-importing ATPase